MELIAVFAPLLAFTITFLFGKKLGDKAVQFITCTAVIAAAISSIMLFVNVVMGEGAYVTTLAEWVNSGFLKVSWALRVDTLSVVMMCVINIVSACVHVYSVGYMSHDEHQARFMAYLSLFTFAMLMLVTADNLLQMFFGWEGVGLASYLLIGFWNYKASANAAAQKAFVVNRIGDFGLALGAMALFAVFGSINFSDIFETAEAHAETYFTFFGGEFHALTTIGLLLFIGAMGKSAQLGLHVWLPDAMEGPTPVSALIHAATMVTAGVFLVARFSPVLEYAPITMMVITIVGALTAFVAATIGLTQFDIKRVIAYSTMSQLGYMFFALGVSAYSAAMFHLMTHAFFKALLFLGAGSVIHAMSNEQDIRRMGGIWKKIPVTYVLMWIGSLALAGIPPFAGFFSKDIVLEAAWADHTWFGHLAYWLGIAAAFMTAFYSWRLLLLTFHGKSRADHEVMDHIHESPPVMLGPLFVLATGAILAGFIFYTPFVGGHEAPVAVHAEAPAHEEAAAAAEKHAEEQGTWNRQGFWGAAIMVQEKNDTIAAAHHVPKWVKFLPLVMGVSGILLAYLFYLWRPGLPARIVGMFHGVHRLFFNKWFFDEIYRALFVENTFRLGRVFWKSDKKLIDGLGPDGSAKISQKFAGVLSRFQTGFIYQYAFVMMIAVVALLGWFAVKQVIGK